MRKKISLFILILTLCLGSNVFAAKSWSESEFEKFMNLSGYDVFDLSSLNFTSSYGTYNAFISKLNDSSESMIILKGNNVDKNSFDNSKFYVLFGSPTYFMNYGGKYVFSNYTYQAKFTSTYTFDLSSGSVGYSNNSSYDGYVPYTWYNSNCTVSEEEWGSKSYKTYLFENACVFSDTSIPSTDYVPYGGKITSSSIDTYPDSIFNGSISYYPTTETVSINYTSGFDSSVNYDLFLEQYRLDNDSIGGVSAYPIDTIDLGKVNTSVSSMVVSANKFMDSAHYIYRICVGVNNFSTSGKNEIVLGTDWLIPNDNTISMYPDFARSHYFTFLSLVDYNPDYDEPYPDDTPSEDEGESGGDIADYLPYFISVPAYPQTDEFLIYFYVGDYGIYNLKLLIEEIDENGNVLDVQEGLTVDSVSFGMCKTDLCKRFRFKDNSFYRLKLLGKNDVVLDTSSIVYFLGFNSGNYEGNSPYIIDCPFGFVKNSGDVTSTIFIPSDYEGYEDYVYLIIWQYNLSGDIVDSFSVDGSSVWHLLDVESGVCPVRLDNYCSFDDSGNYYYLLELRDVRSGTLDTSEVFYFNLNTEANLDKDKLPSTPNNPSSNPSFDFDTSDFDGLINSTRTWVGSIFSFLNIFPSWLVTCIISSIAVVVLCRILGR